MVHCCGPKRFLVFSGLALHVLVVMLVLMRNVSSVLLKIVVLFLMQLLETRRGTISRPMGYSGEPFLLLKTRLLAQRIQQRQIPLLVLPKIQRLSQKKCGQQQILVSLLAKTFLPWMHLPVCFVGLSLNNKAVFLHQVFALVMACSLPLLGNRGMQKGLLSLTNFYPVLILLPLICKREMSVGVRHLILQQPVRVT